MKRILALILCLALCLSLIPAAFAGDIELVDTEDETILMTEPAEEPEEIILIDAPDAAPPVDETNDYPGGDLGNGLSWQLVSNLLIIDGVGNIPNYEPMGAPWYEYRDQITALTMRANITGIGDYAFYNLKNLKTVKDPPWQLKSIGDYAFLFCSSLQEIAIQHGATSIGTGAFQYCTSLRRVCICSAPTIGSEAFANCGTIDMFSFLNGVPSFSSTSFSSTTVTKAWYPPNGLWSSSDRQNYGGTLNWNMGYRGWAGEDIDWELSDGELSLTGTGYADMEQHAGLYSLRSLITSASVGEGITGLEYTFFALDKLRTVRLPDSLTLIGYSTFERCESLERIEIPASVEEIRLYAFREDTALKEVRFCGPAPEFETSELATRQTFYGVTATVYYPPCPGWTEDVRQQYTGTLTWVCDNKVGDNVTWSLDDYGELKLSGSGSTWDFNDEYPGFYYSRSLCKSAVVGSGVTRLGQWLFYRMDKLRIVTIGSGVTTVDYGAVSYSDSIKTIRFKGHPPTITNGAFLGVKATANYPPVPDWTSDVMQNYGGTITWACDDKVGDNVTWWLSSGGVLNLTGSGTTWDWPSNNPDFYYFQSEVTSIEVGPGITGLGNWLFYCMSSATKLTLPKGLESVGRYAFRSCTALTEVRFKGHAPTIDSTAFYGDTATVYYYPVYSWNSDTKKDYGGSLSWVCDDKIGANTTWELYSNGLLWIGGSGATDDFPGAYPAFYSFVDECEQVAIGASVTKLGTHLFYNMDSVLGITVNEGSLATISSLAFGNMTALKWIHFKGNAPSFASDCFYNVTAKAQYHSSKSGWTSSVMQDYRGDITWVDLDSGYVVTITDYTKGAATCSLVNGSTYSGSQTFTVSADKAVLVAVKNGSGYTALSCTTSGSTHKFTVNISAATEIVLVYKGDANLNGKLETRDATLICQIKNGAYGGALEKLAADVNGNGKVETRDATLLCQARNNAYTIPW